MKNKHIISIFIIGIIIVFVGAILKINHILLLETNVGNVIMITGMCCQLLALVFLVLKLLRNKNVNNFWNS